MVQQMSYMYFTLYNSIIHTYTHTLSLFLSPSLNIERTCWAAQQRSVQSNALASHEVKRMAQLDTAILW